MKLLKHKFVTLALAGILLLTAEQALSQTKSSDDKLQKATWASLSFGMGGGNTPDGNFAFMWNANYQRKNFLFSLRSLEAVSVLSFFFFPFSLFLPADENDRISEYAVMAGLATRSKSYHASITAGLAAVTVSSFSVLSKKKSKILLGIPLEAQLFWKATRFLGIGIGAYGNLNDGHSFGGMSLGIQIGRLR